MSIPAYKIETLTGAVLDHTIEHEAFFRFKEILTDGIGNFVFTIPTKKIDYVFNDIVLHDKVKFYVGYTTVPANPNFIGRVTSISAPLRTESGFIRVISGLSQGEILLRRQKKNKFYTGTNASVIVTEWANDLGLGTGDITADTNQPDIEVRTKTYFDLMRQISDYWIDGANQIKKDFYVDIDFDLVWKVRPLRSAGVETFTVGKNIEGYSVAQKVEPVKNEITIYGSADKPLPLDKDTWTESLTDWTASVGSLVLDAVTFQVGAKSIRAWDNAGGIATFKRDIPRTTIRDINKLFFWSIATPHMPTTLKVRLHAPDNANYFHADFTTGGAWTFNEFDLGAEHEYHATGNPNGTWTLQGSPNWWDIEFIEFYADYAPNSNAFVFIDGLWFFPKRWSNTASDAGSQTSYGQRDLEITDDKLHSDTECQRRAETLEFTLKNHPTQITLLTKGNTNVLIGDRLSMTIPAENISAVNYDIFSVEHSFYPQPGWQTRAVMVNSVNIRREVSFSPMQKLVGLRRKVRELTIDRNIS